MNKNKHNEPVSGQNIILKKFINLNACKLTNPFSLLKKKI